MRSKKKIAYGEKERLERDWILFHKRKAVLEHRKMWKWIAHAIAVDKENMYEDIWKYKNEYLKTMILLNEEFKNEAVTEVEKEYYNKNISYYIQTLVDADCFCCMFMFKYMNHALQFEIVSDRSYRKCEYNCPVVWERKTISGTKETDANCSASYYGIITNKAFHKEWKKCCKLAYKIAMLPERSIEDYV